MTDSLLNDVQCEFSKLEQMIDALELIVSELDAADNDYARKQRNAMIGITDAIVAQIKKAQGGYEVLFPALQALRGAA